ncbi:MAG: hypothetical protein LLG04_12075 [Parachlamydia sp.]|nr:hypothetical protein [Parachlamydia sp.]
MQAPTLPIFPAHWRQLQSHEEIRIRKQDTTIQLISQQTLHQNSNPFHNHVETLYILSQLVERLFFQPRLSSDALLDNRVDTIHRRIFESFNLNPQAAPNRSVLDPIHTELQEMIAFILQRRENKKAIRTAGVPKKEASPERKGDEIRQLAAEAPAPSAHKKAPVLSSLAEQQKHFHKVVKSLEQQEGVDKRLKQQKEQQAQTLAQAHNGYNPLDPNTDIPGNYFQFIRALDLRIGNQESVLLPCRQKVEGRLKAFLNCSLATIQRSEECRDLLERWTQWVDADEVDRIQLGRLIGLCLSEEQTFLLLSQALKDDLTDTNLLNEVFRSTHLLRGTIIG